MSGRLRRADDIKGSAALAGGLIVVGDYSGKVHALDPATGAERWTYRGGRRFYGGPAVSGDTIVIGDVGGAVIALDARSGAELWRHSTGAFVYSTAAIARGTAYIGSYSGRFRPSTSRPAPCAGRSTRAGGSRGRPRWSAGSSPPCSRGRGSSRARSGWTRATARCATAPPMAVTRRPSGPGPPSISWGRGTSVPIRPERRRAVLGGAAAALLVVVAAVAVIGVGLLRGWFDSSSVEGTTEGFEPQEAPVGRVTAGS